MHGSLTRRGLALTGYRLSCAPSLVRLLNGKQRVDLGGAGEFTCLQLFIGNGEMNFSVGQSKRAW